MSTLAKIIIGALCLFLILGAGAVVLAAGSIGALGVIAGRTFTDPTRINTAAARIADFDLPPGYKPEVTAEIAGYLFVSYAPGDGHSHIQFVHGPANAPLDQPTLDGLLRQAGNARGVDTSSRSQVVGFTQAMIRGEMVTLVIGQDWNHDGQPFKTLSGVFDGKGGPTFVSVESPIISWNQAEVDAFIASIR